MIVWVFGSRDWANSAKIYSRLDALPRKTTVVEGGAKGADTLARLACRSLKIPYVTVEAEWDKYGRSAGPKRNQKIVMEFMPDLGIAFWDGKSKGTKGSIDLCIEFLIPFEVHF